MENKVHVIPWNPKYKVKQKEIQNTGDNFIHN